MAGSTTFPDDDNGDVLRNMLRNGDDLSEARMLDFEHIFPSDEKALAFVARALTQTDQVRLSWYEDARCWNVQVSRYMVPEHKAIGELESHLRALAREHGGDSDGWGCLQIDKRNDS